MNAGHVTRKSKRRIRPYYRCDICKEKFRSIIRLDARRQEIHDIAKPTLNRNANIKLKANCRIYPSNASKVNVIKLDVHCHEMHGIETTIKKHLIVKPICDFKQSGHLDCSVCQMNFQCKRQKQNHFIEKHKQERDHFSCSECSATFQTNDLHDEHVELHSRVNLPTCQFCGESFSYQSELVSHITSNGNRSSMGQLPHFPSQMKKVGGDPDRPFTCSKCHKTFLHVLTRCEPAPEHQCPMCPYKTRYDNRFKTHMYQHTGVPAFKCDVCNKSYLDEHYLKIHQRLHTGEKKSKLTTHMRFKHDSVKKNNCYMRGKTFNRRPKIVAHLNWHTNNRQFKCKLCKCSYMNWIYLRRHELHIQ